MASGAGINVGVQNVDSSPTMTNVTATSSGEGTGVYNENSGPTIRQSTLSGPFSLELLSGGNLKVADTQLVGSVVVDSGTLQCFGNYDQNMNEVTCP